MKNILLILLGLFTSSVYAQDSYTKVIKYDHRGDIVIDGEFMYLPKYDYDKNRTNKKNSFRILKIVKASGKLVKEIELPKKYRSAWDGGVPFTVENGILYGTHTEYKKSTGAFKYDLSAQKEIWYTEYPSYQTGAARPPRIIGDKVLMVNTSGIYLFDKKSGKKIFGKRFKLNSLFVAFKDNKILRSNNDGEVECYDITQADQPLWTFKTGAGIGHYRASFDGDNVLIPCAGARMYSLNFNTGKLNWKYVRDELKKSCPTGFHYTPIVHGDYLYFTELYAGLFILNKDTGEEVHLEAIGQGQGAGHQGALYKNRFVIFSTMKQLIIIDSNTNKIIKRIQHPQSMGSNVILDNNKAIIANEVSYHDLKGTKLEHLNIESAIVFYDLDAILKEVK